MSSENDKPSGISNSKNLLLNSNVNIGGNLHIGDIYISGEYNNIEDEHLLADFPLPADISYPPSPFVGLKRFNRAAARIFFGRDWFILKLIERLEASRGANVILLYGPSGVGKSSLLEAGVFPRLAQRKWDLHYYRFNKREKIAESVLRLKEQQGLAKAPTLIVVDQLEEYYTSAAEGDLDKNPIRELIESLKGITQSQNTNFKFVLSFRKEYLPEIESALIRSEVLFSKFFLTPLSLQDTKGILERLSQVKDASWQLKFTDNNLPAQIATELSKDDQSPLAPLLQITMKDLWSMAVQKSASTPQISGDTYRQYQRNGMALEDFFDRQLSKVEDQEAIKIGLYLDILKFFTTPYQTSATYDQVTIEKQYKHLEISRLKRLVGELKKHYLLSDDATDERKRMSHVRLMHDALGPVITKKFMASTLSGQQARRILENRSAEIKAAISNSESDTSKTWSKRGWLWRNLHPANYSIEHAAHTVFLNKRELALIDQGYRGMRSQTPAEQKLITISRKQIRWAQYFNWSLGVLITALGSIIIWGMINITQRNRAEYIEQLSQAKAYIDDCNYAGALAIYDDIPIWSYQEEFWTQISLMTDNYLLCHHVDAEEGRRITEYLLEITPSTHEQQFVRAHWAFLYSLSGEVKIAKKLFAAPVTLEDSTYATNTPALTRLAEFEAHYGKLITDFFKAKYLPELIFVESISAVDMPDFWMAKYEITNQQFLSFINLNYQVTSNPITGLEKHAERSWKLSANISPLRPVMVDAATAFAYAEWIEGVLPTVQEWEYAAKGGKKPQAFIYPGGEDLSELAIYSPDFLYPIEEGNVGSKRPNSIGIYDLAGNAAEWTSSTAKDGFFIVKGGGADSTPFENDHVADLLRIDNREFYLSLTAGTAGIRFIIR